MKTTELTIEILENDGRQWFEINGVDYGTGYEFRSSFYALTESDEILDCDGYPLTEGDLETIAIRNAFKKIEE